MPGVVPGRFGHRKPQAINYATYSPPGPYFDPDLQVWLGGNFWDGRAPDTAAQARMPFIDADEMDNTPVGPYPPHSGGYSPLVAQKVTCRPYAWLFDQAFGPGTLALSTDAQKYNLVTQAIAAYEASAEVSQFSSKFDASQYGVPPMKEYTLSRSEANGQSLFFDKAQCSLCHSSASLTVVLQTTGGKDAFTMYCYANIGVPKNPDNPFYTETDATSNPIGFNPLGTNFIDYGLGGNPNPSPAGARFMNATPGDIAQFRGLFKAPTVRNVDKRPDPDFVKAFMHNGVFKSMEEVVHFYNKRNVAVDASGHELAFDLRIGPPKGYTRLFPPPEVLDNVQNVAGVSPDNATEDVESNGQVGNLGLTADEEADLVSFMKILTDGYTMPNPVDAPKGGGAGSGASRPRRHTPPREARPPTSSTTHRGRWCILVDSTHVTRLIDRMRVGVALGRSTQRIFPSVAPGRGKWWKAVAQRTASNVPSSIGLSLGKMGSLQRNNPRAPMAESNLPTVSHHQ